MASYGRRLSHGQPGGGGGQEPRVVLDYEYSTSNLVGHGAFALVFKGRRKRTLETVAIKQISLKSAPGHLSAIRQKEITILKEVKHQNVVQLFDYHEDKSHIYLVMEYCNGGDLGDYLQAKHTLSEDSIRHLTNHIANALSALHSQHIIHRDIKPQNLLLSYPPLSLSGAERERRDHRTITEAVIKLADFGFARHLDGADMAATLCGSPLYMAPEILLGERYDAKADLWSVGTILYQCLAGSAPFVANNPHALRRRYEREKLVPKIPEGTSRHLASLLSKLLRKNPRDRLSHEELLVQPFLDDPSVQASGYLMMSPSPPRPKSSPVPIRRHTPSPAPSPYISCRQSASPHQSPYEMFVSPSSGPPSIHPVGSASSLARHHSPHSDITDHGFILVESPHLSSSPHSTTSSPHSGSYGSCQSHTPSSTGHTPSSYGSLSMQRLRSLTTPFYQAPPTSQSSNGSTPSVKASNVVANSPPSHFEKQGRARSNSNSNSYRRRYSEPHAPLSHTPPFGRLMQLAVSMATTQSPPTGPSRPISSSPSPSSFKYSLVSHGSGSKLSSLVEQVEREGQAGRESERQKRGSRRGKKVAPVNNKAPPSLAEKQVSLDQLITTSQLLQSDDEGEVDEPGFPLSLSLHSSSSDTDEQETTEVNGDEGGGRSSECKVATPRAPPMAGDRKRRSARAQKRGSSFNQSHSEQLKETFQQIQSQAASLSSQHSQLEGSRGGHTHLRPAAVNEYHFQVASPMVTEIKPVTPTFQLSSKTSHLCSDSAAPLSNHEENCSDSQVGMESSGAGSARGRVREGVVRETGEGVRVCLVPLQQAIALATELVGMAQARQGPIMLLSTDLSSSGGASRSVRYSEQLVLYAKALAILEVGLRQFHIEMAASCMELDQKLRIVEVEANEMQETCLDRAKQIREEMDKMRNHHTHSTPSPSPSLSAERLLLLEALDMCKHAVLSEQAGNAKECVKKYRIAKLIFTHLLSEAKTHHDRHTLTNYVESVTRRMQKLASSCSHSTHPFPQ